MAKMLQFNQEGLRSILKGLEVLAKAVSVTLGPKGRNVVIHRSFGLPLSTKDGVTVVKEIYLKDLFEDMGAQLVKEVASRTSEVAGDGTTTAIVLAEAIFREGIKNVTAGANPMLIKRGLERGLELLLRELDRLSKPVDSHEEVENIATISANNDRTIGALIAQAMDKVGKDGIITADEAKGIETTLDVVEGMQIDKGYVSPYFVTNPQSMSVEFERCQVLITDQKLTRLQQIVPLLEKVVAAGSKPLLIVAEEIEGEALATLVVNRLKGQLLVAAVKAPGFGDRRKAMLEDMAILTGGQVVSEEVGLDLEKVGLEVLGHAKRVVIRKDETTLVDGMGERSRVKARELQLRAEIAATTSDYEREQLETRLAKLVGGVAVVHVGAPTEAEMKEKKARVEDALHATRAAVAEGIVPGGGVALLRAIKALEGVRFEGEEQIGLEILRKVAFAPAAAIARNCGENGDLIAEKVYEMSGGMGFNGATGKFGDLPQEGVIDPVRVTKSALSHALSVAALLLSTAALVAEKPEPQGESASPGGMGGMGGMPGMGGMGGMPGMGGMGF